jgi:hypothetical protein
MSYVSPRFKQYLQRATIHCHFLSTRLYGRMAHYILITHPFSGITMNAAFPRLFSVALLSLIVSACAFAPPKPKSFNQLGKFEQYQLNQATFRVSFSGDPDMPQSRAEEIILLKAAKATVEAGYRFFHVVEQSQPQPQPRRSVVYPDYPPGFYHGYGYRRWGYGYPWGDPFYAATVYNLDPVEISYTIACSNTPSEQRDEFDAKLILQSLGPKYHLNPDGSAHPIEPPVPLAPPAKAATP